MDAGDPRAGAHAGGGVSPLDPSDSALLETLILSAPVAFAFYDLDLRYRRINQALADTNGLPIEAHVGHRPSEILPAVLGFAIEEVLRRVIDEESVVTDDDFTARSPVDGALRHWQSQWFPARAADGTLVGVAVLVSDVTDRRRAEAALRRNQELSARLLQAADELAVALTVDEVARVMVDIGGNAVGARWTGVALPEGSTLRYRVSGKAESLSAYLPEISTDLPIPTSAAFRTGEPIYLADRPELLAHSPSELVTRFLEHSDEHAWALLPLRSGGRTLGVLRFAFDQPRRLDHDDRTFLEALAGQCAIALERSRLYERERRTASALQESLLPQELPEVPGLELGARFLPGTSEVAVGGDWYDVFPLPDGRVAAVVGDVMGKGVGAAAGMGRVRSALRALALIDPSPAAVVTGLDRIYTATESIDEIATLVYLVVDPATGEVRAGDAGHLPLLLVPAAGEPRLVDIAPEATPLGLPEPREEHLVRLAPGDVLVGFSDGLVERRGASLDDGLEQLLRVAAGVPRGRALGDLVSSLVGGLVPEGAADDVTVLAVRRTGVG